MLSPTNIDIKHGFLCENAQVFLTQSGRPKICFRIMVPRDKTLPRKKPLNADFFSVVVYGDRYLDLLPLLSMGREVLTIGVTQSRDESDSSVVTEILARELIVLPSENAPRVALAQFLIAELEADRQKYGEQWSPDDLGQWIAEKLQIREVSGEGVEIEISRRGCFSLVARPEDIYSRSD